MPWKEVSTMFLREEMVRLASQPDAQRRQIFERFGISPKTGYKWLNRFVELGADGLADQSRRPQQSPARTLETLEQLFLKLKEQYPAWGARKLLTRAQTLNPHIAHWPAASTVHAILLRHGCIDTSSAAAHPPFQRFEHPRPNALLQMDFKGHVAMHNGQRCHPLTVLDDHSRFNLCLRACANEQGNTVKSALIDTFRCYGLPDRIATDNGSPWGDTFDSPFTPLGVWLIQLGIKISHSRPYHPQTLGKDERFHRTFKLELLSRQCFDDLLHAQHHFDTWRQCYNLERPHQAIDMQTPVSRYQPSPRAFPEQLPSVEYGPGETVRRVQQKGQVHYRGQCFKVSKAFTGQPVAIRPDLEHDGHFKIYFCNQKIAEIDIRQTQSGDL